MTVREAAAVLGCSVRHARGLCQRGALRAECLGEITLDGKGVRWYWVIDSTSVAQYKSVKNRRGWPRGKPRKENQ